MKILITGAHFTPALAVIEQLKKITKAELVYVGRKTTLEGDITPSVESKVLPLCDVKFIPIITGRLQRTFSIYTIISILKIPVGLIHSLYIILSEKPDVILSFGGYVGVPVVIIGWLLSIPIIVHEQTLVPGLANQISFLFADKIAHTFLKNTKLDQKNLLTGNPMRQEILHPENIPPEYQKIFNNAKKEKLPVILVTGGNQGSHVLNTATEDTMLKLTKVAFIIHVTGDSKYHDFERLESLQNERYLVKKWIGPAWGAVLSKVDLVISRAGINTLTELAFFGKPALVIPIPYLYKNEQVVNARFFKELGLAEVILQSKLSGESLMENIKAMLSNLESLKKKAAGAKEIIIPDASQRLALETVLIQESRYAKNL